MGMGSSRQDGNEGIPGEREGTEGKERARSAWHPVWLKQRELVGEQPMVEGLGCHGKIVILRVSGLSFPS